MSTQEAHALVLPKAVPEKYILTSLWENFLKSGQGYSEGLPGLDSCSLLVHAAQVLFGV